jgi:tRNA dimethylallyltransferase
MSEKHLISIIGPTGVGKTSLAIAISTQFKAPIISSDSRQFYKEMSIGTAVPTPKELAAAPHHFIQHKSIHEPYSVGDFEKEAMAFLEHYYKENSIAILVGGSGLYTDAVCQGLDYFPKVPISVREDLNTRLLKQGLVVLQEELKIVDPISFKNIAIDNPVRVIRALEIYQVSGQPYSSFLNKAKTPRPFKIHTLGIEAPREDLYKRINLRVEHMLAAGLVAEAKLLYPLRNLNALKTVGYKELFSYFNNEIDLKTAIEEIKKNSRRFAKRQSTWNRKKTNVHWVSYKSAFQESMDYLNKNT